MRPLGSIVMRRFILSLAVALFAGPAWAVVTIRCEDEGGGVFRIEYVVEGEPNKVRAFALDITISDGVIEAIYDYHVGQSTAANPGYGIFPANFGRYIIVDPATGEVTDWDVNDYTPVVDPNDTGALGGLGTAGITVEMASLYYPTGDDSPDVPLDSGTLFRIRASEEPHLSIAENSLRGGIVLTDPNVDPTVYLEVCPPWPPPPPYPCFPDTYSTYNDWVTMGKPDCWCELPYGSGYQCDGDADGATETFFKYRIYGKDLGLIVDNWKRKIDDPLLDPCADIDHKSETVFNYRVYGKDLAKIVENWRKKDVDLAGDCPRPE